MGPSEESLTLRGTGLSEETRIPTLELDPDLSISAEELRQGRDIWERMRAGREMPRCGDVDPLQMPARLLPHVLLADVEHGSPRRYRWRLIGTHITHILKRDRTGVYWDEAYPGEHYEELIRGPQWVVENRKPLRITGTGKYFGSDWYHFESLNLPLSHDGELVDRIIMFARYDLFSDGAALP